MSLFLYVCWSVSLCTHHCSPVMSSWPCTSQEFTCCCFHSSLPFFPLRCRHLTQLIIIFNFTKAKYGDSLTGWRQSHLDMIQAVARQVGLQTCKGSSWPSWIWFHVKDPFHCCCQIDSSENPVFPQTEEVSLGLLNQCQSAPKTFPRSCTLYFVSHLSAGRWKTADG